MFGDGILQGHLKQLQMIYDENVMFFHKSNYDKNVMFFHKSNYDENDMFFHKFTKSNYRKNVMFPQHTHKCHPISMMKYCDDFSTY